LPPAQWYLASFPTRRSSDLDCVFYRYLRSLASCRRPRLSNRDGRWELLPPPGDHVHLNGIDRWLGGVHLQGAEARWRWDEKNRRSEEHTSELQSLRHLVCRL